MNTVLADQRFKENTVLWPVTTKSNNSCILCLLPIQMIVHTVSMFENHRSQQQQQRRRRRRRRRRQQQQQQQQQVQVASNSPRH